MGHKVGKVFASLLPLKYNGSRYAHSFSTFGPMAKNKGCWPDVVVLHDRLSLSSKPWDSIIFWIIWCTLLPQHSILHDLFTIGFNGKSLRGAQTFRPSCRLSRFPNDDKSNVFPSLRFLASKVVFCVYFLSYKLTF